MEYLANAQQFAYINVDKHSTHTTQVYVSYTMSGFANKKVYSVHKEEFN